MGVVLYILLCGKVPFPGDSNKEIIENVSEEAKDLIKCLLVKDVNRRYSSEQAFNHSWI